MAVLAPSSHVLCRELCRREQQLLHSGACASVSVHGGGFVAGDEGGGRRRRRRRRRRKGWRGVEVMAWGSWQEVSRPSSIEMEPLTGVEQLDEALRRSQELSQPILIDWMATWCRKCIYLKPKLEKLAAEFHPRIKFYYVDVNNVPQALVKSGNISKMPTIQLWKDGEWKDEIIGGHKAWLVIDERRAPVSVKLPSRKNALRVLGCTHNQ